MRYRQDQPDNLYVLKLESFYQLSQYSTFVIKTSVQQTIKRFIKFYPPNTFYNLQLRIDISPILNKQLFFGRSTSTKLLLYTNINIIVYDLYPVTTYSMQFFFCILYLILSTSFLHTTLFEFFCILYIIFFLCTVCKKKF